ncbi:hypothetical protein SVIO_040080 [Streptomyces violaceusniger]|uniref:Uncharacterized protein n=1 Tax=Streptomyces violaceusniger TaxID=68280 RepID=A0A4D4KWP3_STRVO|nr:hypothetical protein SVIO_040080 [Streptomyces violaceusniger]
MNKANQGLPPYLAYRLGAPRLRPAHPAGRHDHSHPGWRDLPAIPERRGRHWLTHAQCLYPDGWFERSGPIRTIRIGIEKRHKPGAAPGGGYDLAVQPPKRIAPVAAVAEVLPLLR